MFVHKRDLEGVEQLQRGQAVDFLVYADSTGLGAEECRPAEPDEAPPGGEAAAAAREPRRRRGAGGEAVEAVIKTIAKTTGARKWPGRQPAQGDAQARGVGGDIEGEHFQDPLAASRSRVFGRRRFTGIVKKWQGKFGFITPDEPIEHEAAELHGGDIFLHLNDVIGGEQLKRGDGVDFTLYADDGGLGAEGCRMRPARMQGDSGSAWSAGKGGGGSAPHCGKSSGKAGGKAAGTAAAATASAAVVPGGGGSVKRKIAKAKAQSSARPQALVVAPELPEFWEQHWSDEHNVPYYWNSVTKESSWTQPEE